MMTFPAANAIYRREFGEDLPILTGEVRQVMGLNYS